MARGKWFWNLISGLYAKQKIADEAAYEHKLAKTQDLFTGSDVVLEIACGTGTTAVHHAPNVAQITGIDYAPKMVEIAQQRATDAGISNATFLEKTVDTLDTDTPYDVVMAHSILHLMPNWREVIQKCFTLTKPGGYYVTSTTCIGESGGFMLGLLKLDKVTRLVPPLQFFTQDALLSEMKKAGFEITYEYHAKQSDHPGKDGAIFVIAHRPA